MRICEAMGCNEPGQYTDPKLEGEWYCQHHRRRALESLNQQEIRELLAEIVKLREALKREAEFQCRKCMRKHAVKEIQSILGERIWVHKSGEHTTVCSASHIHEALEKTDE